jgi:hypothetical protein
MASQFSSAPKPLKWLIFSIATLSFVSTQVKSFFGLIPPFQLFGLSTWGLKHGFIWQLLTFGMLQEPSADLTFSFLISLFFNLYILYTTGLALIQIKGLKDFCLLFFGGLAVTGILLGAALFISGSQFSYCSSSVFVFLALTSWMMMDPERQLLLFMTIPIKIKWLVLIFFGSQIFVEFANGNLVEFVSLFTPCLYSWLFCVARWKRHSPIPFLHPVERLLMGIKRSKKGANIYDFQTGRIVILDAPIKAKKKRSFFSRHP